ncbi:MAG: histidine kinase dimerization/phospho-acceptor domain-containing protein, partial [Pseudomonadota bacterium]
MAIDTDYTEINRRRRRDIAILASGSILLLLVLWVTGALGWIECLTAVLLIAGGAFAYHVGIVASARVHRPAIRTRSPRSSRANQHQAQQMIIAALQQPAMVIDAAGGLVVYNLSAAEIFNLPAGRMGFSAASLRHPELLTSVERVLSEGGSVTCELSAVRQPGQVWLAKVTELVSGDTVRAVLVVMTDQGPVRRAEKARADFLANASHELRTPLTSISGFLETMQGAAREDREAWPRFVDIMADQTAHMRDLISDLLSLSRIELSEHKAPTTEVDFANIVNEVIEAMMPVAEARGVALCVEGEAG